MRVRSAPRVVPSRPHYFRVDLHAEIDSEVARRRAVVEEITVKASTVAEEDREAAVAAAAKRSATIEHGIARLIARREELTPVQALHVFRTPNFADVAVMSSHAVKSQLDAKLAIADGQVPASVFATLGLMVAGCWFHPMYDLEAGRQADLEAWGAVVYDELYEAGYSTFELRVLAKACADRIAHAVVSEAEVRERVGFSSPTPGAAT